MCDSSNSLVALLDRFESHTEVLCVLSQNITNGIGLLCFVTLETTVFAAMRIVRGDRARKWYQEHQESIPPFLVSKHIQ